jgi:hypothetical protein
MEEHTKTEKIRTTKYIPMQNRRGCREPNTSWRLDFFIRYELKNVEIDTGYALNDGKGEIV